MVLAIGHLEGDTVIVDALRSIAAPFAPSAAVEELAYVCDAYGVKRIKADAYSGRWCQQAFEQHGIGYDYIDQNRSALYLDLLPRLNSKTIRLIEHERALNELCQLERRTGRGRDVVDHPKGGSDDHINAIAGLAAAF